MCSPKSGLFVFYPEFSCLFRGEAVSDLGSILEIETLANIIYICSFLIETDFSGIYLVLYLN